MHEISMITIQGIGTQLQVNPFGALYSGLSAFFTSIFLFIPNLIAALLILLVGYLIVRAVTGAVRWALNKANLERHVGNTRIGQAVERSGSTITNITVSVVKWLMLLVVIVYAISALAIPPLTASMLGILAWIPNLIGVAIIVFAGLLIGSYIGKALENTLPKYGVGAGRLIGLVVEALIYLFVFDLAIIQLGIGQGIVFMVTTALTWGLAAALAIGFGGALFYSLRQVVPPMISGSTTIASTLKPGQVVSLQGIPNIAGVSGMGDGGSFRGRVSDVGIFNTILQREQGGYVVIPNELLMDKPLVIESGDVPRTLDEGLRNRVSELNDKFEQNQRGDVGSDQSEQTVQQRYRD
jgi:small-conductance mechanosensitive channel